MLDLDRLIIAFDNGLRTLLAPAHGARAMPGATTPEPEMTQAERQHAAALMRVNHTGEICAQALYQGQALTARNAEARAALEQAAAEETDHLAWTAQRIDELGGRTSLLNPLWYAGAFAIGAAAGALGCDQSLPHPRHCGGGVCGGLSHGGFGSGTGFCRTAFGRMAGHSA